MLSMRKVPVENQKSNDDIVLKATLRQINT